MERLTYRYGPDGLAVPTEFDIGPIANIHDDDIWVGFDTLLSRLAAYEDKIPFDRLDEAAALVKARDEGRGLPEKSMWTTTCGGRKLVLVMDVRTAIGGGGDG